MLIPDRHAKLFWILLSATFFAIGIIGALGEWVFHWWQTPFDWASIAAIFLGMVTLAWGASDLSVRALRREMRSGFTEQKALLQELRDGQAEQKSLLQELRDGQAEQKSLLQEIRDGQAEQTALLREVVASFRSRSP